MNNNKNSDIFALGSGEEETPFIEEEAEKTSELIDLNDRESEILQRMDIDITPQLPTAYEISTRLGLQNIYAEPRESVISNEPGEIREYLNLNIIPSGQTASKSYTESFSEPLTNTFVEPTTSKVESTTIVVPQTKRRRRTKEEMRISRLYIILF